MKILMSLCLGAVIWGLAVLAPAAHRTTSLSETPRLAMYFLAHPTAPSPGLFELALDDLLLEATPWLTDADIAAYEWSNHVIYLKTGKAELLNDILDGPYLNRLFVPFVVTVDGERCYLAGFHSMLSSTIPDVPLISDGGMARSAQDMIQFGTGKASTSQTLSDPRIEQVLKETGLYRPGLDFTLASVARADGTTLDGVEVETMLEYEFTLTNRDDDDLLVMDPEAMGSAFFYYSGGLWLQNLDTNEHLRMGREAQMGKGGNEIVYTRVASGATRRFTLRSTFAHLAPGRYACRMRFPAPEDVARADRIRDGARIWLGDLTSDVFELVVESRARP